MALSHVASREACVNHCLSSIICHCPSLSNQNPKPELVPSFPSPLLRHVFFLLRHWYISSAYSNILIDLLDTGFTGAHVYKFTRGSEGPSRWPKATSPLQELEVGTRRVQYLLVADIVTLVNTFAILL